MKAHSTKLDVVELGARILNRSCGTSVNAASALVKEKVRTADVGVTHAVHVERNEAAGAVSLRQLDTIEILLRTTTVASSSFITRSAICAYRCATTAQVRARVRFCVRRFVCLLMSHACLHA
jgi:hypothetical protein